MEAWITISDKKEFYESACLRIGRQSAKELECLREQAVQMSIDLPEWKEKLLEKAEEEYNGMHILPGTGAVPFFVGNPPKWKERRVTDKEYLWSLNRMYHWNDFMLTYYLTGEEKYALKIKEEMLDWISECPPPALVKDFDSAQREFSGVYPWRTLETGIRMFDVWPGVIRFLTVEGFMDADSLYEVAHSVYQHGTVLCSMSPILWPDANHNHYLMENLGLLYVTNLFPEFENAQYWTIHANCQLERCADNQLTGSGAQFEGCPSYHNICMNYFCLWIISSKETGFAVPERIKEMVKRGLDYSLAAYRPYGGAVAWGDSDNDYSAIHAAILGLRAFGDRRWLTQVKKMTESKRFKQETAFCIIDAGGIPVLDLVSEENGENSLPLCSFQKEINQVSYRTSWERDALHLHFGCHMPGRNGHAHIDTLGFEFSAIGRPMLVDPGRFTYDEASDRRLFKSAKMHNCLLIDEKDPFEYLDSWKYGKQHDGCLLKAEEKERYFWAQGIHTCYFPIIHERMLSIIDNRFLLVWDRISHMKNKHIVQLYFHVDENKLQEDSVKGSYYTRNESGKNVYIRPLAPVSSRLLPGYAAEGIDVRHQTTRILYEDREASGSREYATLVVLFGKELPVIRQVNSGCEKGGSCMEFEVSGVFYKVFWDGENFEVK